MPVPRAPDTLVDFHTERDHRVRPSVYASLSCRTCAPRCGRRRDPSLQSPAVPSCLTTNYGVTPAEGIYGPREPVSGGFLSLPLRGVSGGQDERRQPAGCGRGAGGGNHSATSRVGPFQPRHRFGAHRHRLQLSIPMRRTRASGSSGLRMPRGGDLAQKNKEAVAPSAAKARCRARSLAVP